MFSDRGCPFAHRVYALLDHLGVTPKREIVPLGKSTPGLARHSRSGRVPLLVHGPVTIGESRVMLEYLAEAHGLEPYPLDLVTRTLQRHAMALLDATLTPTLISGVGPSDERLAECLDVFEAVMVERPVASVLAFHFAPMWLRFQWWRPTGAVTRAISGRPRVLSWLDEAAALPSVTRTSETLVDLPAELSLA